MSRQTKYLINKWIRNNIICYIFGFLVCYQIQDGKFYRDVQKGFTPKVLIQSNWTLLFYQSLLNSWISWSKMRFYFTSIKFLRQSCHWEPFHQPKEFSVVLIIYTWCNSDIKLILILKFHNHTEDWPAANDRKNQILLYLVKNVT